MAASSNGARPTSRAGSTPAGRSATISASTDAPHLAAHPPHDVHSVSLRSAASGSAVIGVRLRAPPTGRCDGVHTLRGDSSPGGLRYWSFPYRKGAGRPDEELRERMATATTMTLDTDIPDHVHARRWWTL